MLPLFKNPKTPSLRKTPDYKRSGLRSRHMLHRLLIEKRILIWWTLLQSIQSLPFHMQSMSHKCIQWIWAFQWTQCLRKNWLGILNKLWTQEGINLFICNSLPCSQCLTKVSSRVTITFNLSSSLQLQLKWVIRILFLHLMTKHMIINNLIRCQLHSCHLLIKISKCSNYQFKHL